MPGFVSSISNKNDAVFAKNADFTLSADPSSQNGLITDGQLWIGHTDANLDAQHVFVGQLTSPNNTITIGYSSPNITLDLAGGGTAIDSFTPDNGTTPVVPNAAGNVSILGLSGSKTTGGLNTLTIKSPPFSQIGASATSSLNTGEFVTAAVTRTLPASAGLADGDLFIYSCTTANALVIQAVGAQKIRVGTLLSSAAGTATSTAIGDSITLRFDATQGFFMAVSVIGTWLIA